MNYDNTKDEREIYKEHVTISYQYINKANKHVYISSIEVDENSRKKGYFKDTISYLQSKYNIIEVYVFEGSADYPIVDRVLKEKGFKEGMPSIECMRSIIPKKYFLVYDKKSNA
ncbi:MAG: hypothetical protein QM528_08875 [Phycisphaerales bacterium]|nr:hypothetical protein [Phycisphaerales bacterium]